MRIKIVVEPNLDGGFTAFAPALPECVADGDTIEEAVASIRAAIAACLATDEDLEAGEGGQVCEVTL